MKQEIENRINQTLEFIKRNYWPLLIIGVPVFVILEVIGVSLSNMDPNNENPLFSILTLILYFFMNGFVVLLFIYLINSIHTNTPFSLNEVINFIIKSIFNVSLAIWAIKLITSLGIILLIIPGIYLLVRTALAPFLISLDNVNLKDAFRLAFENSEKQSWVMFFSVSILAVPVVISITLRFFAETQLHLSIMNIALNLSYIFEYILFYFFYLDTKGSIRELLRTENPFNPG